MGEIGEGGGVEEGLLLGVSGINERRVFIRVSFRWRRCCRVDDFQRE